MFHCVTSDLCDCCQWLGGGAECIETVTLQALVRAQPLRCHCNTHENSSESICEPLAQMEPLDDEVLEILTSLIAFKNRADAKGWRDAFENMPIYMEVGLLPCGSLHHDCAGD